MVRNLICSISNCEPVELIDDRWRVCLCGGGVGAKERSEISKLSLKLFVREGLSEIDIDDMAVVVGRMVIDEKVRRRQ